MDVVLVGLPGSGKTAIGRRLASRRGAAFVDLDADIERAAGVTIPEIFEAEGEAGFRARERRAIEALGPADEADGLARVIATGGGAVVDPRNRWRLYRGRRIVWLDGRPEVLAQRLRRSPNPRPLIAGRDPIGAIRELAAARGRFYAPATRIEGLGEPVAVVDQIDRLLATPTTSGATTLLRADTPVGEIVIGERVAADAVDAALRRIGAGRAVIVSEPNAWAAAGEGVAASLEARGWDPAAVMLPSGEGAKTLAVIEEAARELADLGVERGDAIVAIGGGALTDPAGFLAASYLRGIPWIAVPTTLVAQIDAAIGGKTGVDLPEGKNLVGAFHQPRAVVIDLATLATLPVRDRRAAMGEAVKMAALGDERLFDLLETDGPAIVSGDAAAGAGGSGLAELVERAAWAKVAVVGADEREAAGRIALNLGHSLGHAVEAAGGYRDLLHGEAVAYGLRAACRIGVRMGVTPEARAARVEALLDRLGLVAAPLPYQLDTVLSHLRSDKKHRAGRLRWVLPTADGHVVRDDVPDELVAEVAAGILAGGAR